MTLGFRALDEHINDGRCVAGLGRSQFRPSGSSKRARRLEQQRQALDRQSLCSGGSRRSDGYSPATTSWTSSSFPCVYLALIVEALRSCQHALAKQTARRRLSWHRHSPQPTRGTPAASGACGSRAFSQPPTGRCGTTAATGRLRPSPAPPRSSARRGTRAPGAAWWQAPGRQPR